jgi:uncharacterized protein
MVNKNSHAGHIPERSCVICRKKTCKEELLRFVILESEIVFDIKRKVSSRGYYVCNENSCIEKLDKWIKKKNRRK